MWRELNWEWFRRLNYNIFTGWWYNTDETFWGAVLVWFIEWTLVFEYLFAEWWRVHVFIPVRVPTILVLCTLYWFFVWGISVWRRTQFGRFTRGDRKLWAKALAAFWVAEFVTILSLLIVYCWMNWGPLPLVPRRLLLPKRGLFFEFIIYTYIIFLGYVAKFSVGWCGWRTQLSLGMLVLIIFSLLLWRDGLCLLFRDPMDSVYGSRWRNVRLTAVVYTLSHEWWIQHTLGKRDSSTYFLSLPWAFEHRTHPYKPVPALTEYEARHWMPMIDKNKRSFKNTWNLFHPFRWSRCRRPNRIRP